MEAGKQIVTVLFVLFTFLLFNPFFFSCLQITISSSTLLNLINLPTTYILQTFKRHHLRLHVNLQPPPPSPCRQLIYLNIQTSPPSTSSSFSDHHHQDLSVLFTQLDLNHDGRVDSSDVILWLKSLGSLVPNGYITSSDVLGLFHPAAPKFVPRRSTRTAEGLAYQVYHFIVFRYMYSCKK